MVVMVVVVVVVNRSVGMTGGSVVVDIVVGWTKFCLVLIIGCGGG